ncbi:MAG: hypothetical protein ACTSR3_23610 [Candidatus Helarchaeota archaeon]
MNNNQNIKQEISNKVVYLYIALIWAWSWIFGFIWITNLKNITLFDTSIILFLGPFIITLIFTIVNNLPAKEIGIINISELKKAPNSLMFGMLIIYFLIMIVLNIYVYFFGLNLPFINNISTILILALIMFLYMLVLALYEESAWSGWLYSNIPAKNFIYKNLLISFSWFVWYIPYFLWFSEMNISFPGIITFFIIFLLYLIPTRFLYSWFREKSKSLYWPIFANSITGTSNFIIVNLIDIIKVNVLLFFGISAIASTLMTIIVYYVFPLENQ